MSQAMQRSDRTISIIIIGSAAILFAASTFNVVLATLHGRNRRQGKRREIEGEQGNASARLLQPQPKLVSQSAVSRMTYATRPDDCQASATAFGAAERPKLHAGALLKLIDIAAGVAARRHSGAPCVTISVDSVVLLKPVLLGDLIHMSASVNRAWGSSMEVGVRIVKESMLPDMPSDASREEYVSHSYLTFVAISSPPRAAAPLGLASIGTYVLNRLLGTASEEPKADAPPSKPLLAPIKTTSRLESRRHLLAGRRRMKRQEDARQGRTREGVSAQVKQQVRQEVQAMLREYDSRQHIPVGDGTQGGDDGRDTLRTIEMEVLIQAWAQGDESVEVQEGMVRVSMPGDEPLQFAEREVRAQARRLGIKVPGDPCFDPTEYTIHGTATPTWAHASPSRRSKPLSITALEQAMAASSVGASSIVPVASVAPLDESRFATDEVAVADTLTTSMHLVFPQHTNSHGIIFGGNTMSWSEEVAIMACRSLRIGRTSAPSWKTVSMDGLEFNVQVGVGE